MVLRTRNNSFSRRSRYLAKTYCVQLGKFTGGFPNYPRKGYSRIQDALVAGHVNFEMPTQDTPGVIICRIRVTQPPFKTAYEAQHAQDNSEFQAAVAVTAEVKAKAACTMRASRFCHPASVTSGMRPIPSLDSCF